MYLEMLRLATESKPSGGQTAVVVFLCCCPPPPPPRAWS
jgi:hypothetical protein